MHLCPKDIRMIEVYLHQKMRYTMNEGKLRFVLTVVLLHYIESLNHFGRVTHSKNLSLFATPCHISSATNGVG